MNAASKTEDSVNKKKGIIQRIKISSKTAPYYFLAPILIIFSVFMIYPIISSFILSFQEFKYGVYKFVGFRNYLLLMKDPVFKAALKNTFEYLIIQVPIMILLALLFANMLNQAYIKLKALFRISIFMPAITALVAYALVFKLLLNTDYGFINYILNWLGLKGIDWLNGPISAKMALVIAMTWRWTGYNMVIMIAGLQAIPEELYEACKIDGASRIQTFFKVTVPLMKPIILFCTITSTIGTLQLFDESYILTNGGPDNATITIAHYLYNTGFRFVNFGYAAAISYVMVLLIAIISFIQFKFVGGDE